MTVAAVRADDVVVVRQRFADANGNRFLAGIQVSETRDLALLDLEVQPLLELPNRFHLPVGAQ